MCLLAAINAKYIHTNLAVRYLRELCGLAMREYSINDRVEAVTADLYRSGHKLMPFSCYIWNIRMVLDICARLKKADPSIVIALGGPEVSFDAPELLERNAQVDFVLCGEGESSLPAFLQAVQSGDFSSVPGLVYRMGNGIRQNAPAPELDMSLLPVSLPSGGTRRVGRTLGLLRNLARLPISVCVLSVVCGKRRSVFAACACEAGAAPIHSGRRAAGEIGGSYV